MECPAGLADSGAKDLAGSVVAREGDRRAVAAYRHAVHDDGLDAIGRVGNEAFAVRGHVTHPTDRSRIETLEIEDDDVRRLSDVKVPAVESHHVGELPRELANAPLERHDVAIAHPACEEVDRHRR